MTTTSQAPVYHHCDACGDAITTADAPVECAECRPPDLVADIVEFHERFRVNYDGKPRCLPDELKDFRLGFLAEELEEYQGSVQEASALLAIARRIRSDDASAGVVEHLASQLDALVDLVYVALGNAHMQGFNFYEAWRRVHRANLAKIRAPDDAQPAPGSTRGGRYDVVKPPGWEAPDHTDLVADHAHVEELGR